MKQQQIAIFCIFYPFKVEESQYLKQIFFTKKIKAQNSKIEKGLDKKRKEKKKSTLFSRKDIKWK